MAVDTLLAHRSEILAAQAIQCKKSYRTFFNRAWSTMEPGTYQLPARHIDAIAEHLQAVADGHIRKLAITIAPGHAKSTSVSQAFPAWVWTRKPEERFLCASHALDLAIRDNRNCRALIESEWYQSLFGDVFQMAQDQNVKSYFENDKRGYRLATAVRSSGTGKRGSILIIDDANNAMAGEADVLATIDWHSKTWQSRLNDLENGAMIAVGQRLHQKDLIGHLLEMGTWEHLDLPTEYEPSRRCFTSIGWSDWRTQEGELLWPERFNPEMVASLKRSLGSMAYAAQYQQRPAPQEGGLFKKQWLRYYSETPEAYILHRPEGTKAVAKETCWKFGTVDLAISSKQSADYTVMAVWGVTPEYDLLLLDLFRDRIDNAEQLRQIKTLHTKHDPDYWRVETVAYQLAFFQQAINEGIPAREYKPVRDKVSRATTAAVRMENGKNYLPKNAAYLTDVETEMLLFPKGEHDDFVDNLAMANDEAGAPRLPMVGGGSTYEEEAWTGWKNWEVL